jgi:hypothetical protein
MNAHMNLTVSVVFLGLMPFALFCQTSDLFQMSGQSHMVALAHSLPPQLTTNSEPEQRITAHSGTKETILVSASGKQRLISTNAAIWAIAILAAFILPHIAASISSGPAKFLKVICFAFPLIAGMVLSTLVISAFFDANK